MSEIQDASDFIKRQANQYKGFVALSDALDKIGPIANAAKEAAAARDAAVKAKDKAEVELKTVLAKIEDAHAMAADVMTKAASEATHQAGLITAKAKEDAKAVIDKANAQAQVITDTYKTAAAQADRSLQALQAETDAESFKLVAAKADLEIAQKEHDKLAKAIEAMKAKFA